MRKKKLIAIILLAFFISFPLICVASESAHRYFESGVSYFDQGRYEEALGEFKKAVTEQPDFAHAYYNMGIVYDKQEKFNEAIDAYQKVLEIDPDIGSVLENLALDSYLVGNFKEAMYYVKFAESRGKPVSQMLQNQIWAEYMKETRGTLLSMSESGPSKVLRRELKEEISAIEGALEKREATPDDLLALGMKYRQIGDIEKAVEILKKALARDQNNAMIYAELALGYYLNDDITLFVQYIKKARELGYKPSVSLRDLYSISLPEN